MAREFTVSGGGQTLVNANVTLVFINPAASPNFNIGILRCWIGQSATATSAQQRVALYTQVTAFPTVVSTTPAKLKRADPNVSVIVGGTGGQGTAGINASAEGAGTKTTIFEDAFNILNGWLYVPTPAEMIVVPAGSASGFGMWLPVAPGNTANWSFGVTFAEL